MIELHLDDNKISDILDLPTNGPKIDFGQAQYGETKHLIYKGYFMICSVKPELDAGMGQSYYIVGDSGKKTAILLFQNAFRRKIHKTIVRNKGNEMLFSNPFLVRICKLLLIYYKRPPIDGISVLCLPARRDLCSKPNSFRSFKFTTT